MKEIIEITIYNIPINQKSIDSFLNTHQLVHATYLFFCETNEYFEIDDCKIEESDSSENVIIFSYSAKSLIEDAIVDFGFGYFFEDILLDLNKQIKKSLEVPRNLFINDKVDEYRFFTVWEPWSTKYWTDYGYEHDSGYDCLGVMDLQNINYIKME